MSPSDIVGPSPVTSVGTEVTEIEDEASDDARLQPTYPDSASHAQVCAGRLAPVTPLLTLYLAPDASNQLAGSSETALQRRGCFCHTCSREFPKLGA